MKQIFDNIRGLWVKATPEEIVRQNIIKQMITLLGYPKERIIVEKNLSTMPFIKNAPDRRLDIICLSKKTLMPLLVIECKAVPLKEKDMQQVLGYNQFIKAPYIVLVNSTNLICGKLHQNEYTFTNQLPHYEEITREHSIS